MPSCKQCENRHKSVFCAVKDPLLSEIDYPRQLKYLKKGETLFSEGRYPKGVYCLYSGKMKVHFMDDNGKEQIVRLTKEGDVIGYRSLIAGERYAASATAIEPVSCCFFPEETLNKIMAEHPEVMRNMMKTLATDLHRAERQVLEMAYHGSKTRLAGVLITLIESYGTDETGILNVTLTRREMGALAGIATETAIRLLIDFQKENYVEFVGRKLRIVNQKELTSLSKVDSIG